MATGKMMSGKYMSMSGLDLSFMQDKPKVDRVDGGPGEPGLVERLQDNLDAAASATKKLVEPKSEVMKKAKGRK